MADDNAPGLSSLSYRLGTHASFKAAMLDGLDREPALRGLTTRDDDDPSIALVDAWATALDVLTFYQERLANEGYLRTASERQSALALARAIGYELGPGVAADTHLAFTLQDAPGSPRTARVPAGTRAQSVPAQDESPQMFETVDDLDARVEWNVLRPEASRVTAPATGTVEIFVLGSTLNIRPGDWILIVGDERLQSPSSDRWDVRRVTEATPVPPAQPSADPAAGYTRIRLDRSLGSKNDGRAPAALNPQVYVFRQRASLFGANAPDWRSMSADLRAAYGEGKTPEPEWPGFNLAYSTRPPKSLDRLYLDALYPRIVAGSWVVVASPSHESVFTVIENVDDSRAEFTLAGKSTRLQLSGIDLAGLTGVGLRDVVVMGESERLAWAGTPLTDAISGNRIVLDRQVDGLAAGRVLAVTGTDAVSGEAAGEIVTLERADVVAGSTRLVLTARLTRTYVRASLAISANVARATHGESRTEILGAGNAALPFQSFALRQRPLTFVSAATASGRTSTLEVRVNKMRWDEVPSLDDRGPAERVYVARLDDDGTVRLRFGDGVTGARVPTGVENVSATYRTGLGTAGLLQPGQISLLMTRPLGVSAVTNPVAPAGAADPETLDDARVNAPLTVLTLDRVVSLQDFEDFTRAFAGIGKAQVTSLWDGERQIVHLTVAGSGGAAVAAASALDQNLRAALDGARDTGPLVRVDSYVPLSVDVAASVLVDAAYLEAEVFAAVRAAIEEAFSFEARAFAQAIAQSEILAVMQGVAGVVAVDLDALHLTGAPVALATAVPARRAAFRQGRVAPAELATVRPDGITIEAMLP